MVGKFAWAQSSIYHEKVKRIRELRPDMVLLSGGVDGGTISHVVELAEIIKTSNPKPRLGMDYKLPIIFAVNQDAQDEVKKIVGCVWISCTLLSMSCMIN